MAGSDYTGECKCAKCCREKGLRTEEKWNEVEKYDYSCMLTFDFWKTTIVRKLTTDMAPKEE
jgi:hypothetical protein